MYSSIRVFILSAYTVASVMERCYFKQSSHSMAPLASFPAGSALTAGHSTVQSSVKRHAVKRHHHKHNIKHRYEFLETLGKGTYGKVKKAVERSGRVVREKIYVLL